MSSETTERAALLAKLGLQTEATDAEILETCRDLERFLEPSRVPGRLRNWAAQEREAAARASIVTAPAMSASQPATDSRRTRPVNLPDFLEEELTAERMMPRPRSVAPTKRPGDRPSSMPVRRPASSRLLTWRGVLLVLVIGVVVAGVFIGAPLLGNQPASTGTTPSPNLTSLDTPPALDQARVDELKKTVAANPTNTQALFDLGEMHFQAEKWQESIDWFTKLLALDPTDNHARLDVGTSSFNLGRYEDAKKAWEEVARRDPKDAQVHFNLGFLYLYGPDENLDQAMVEWRKVIEIAPESQIAQTARTHLDALKK